MTFIPQCFNCTRYRGLVADSDGIERYVCDAFPSGNGIPQPILRDEHDHREAYSGDHGIRYEPKPGSPEDVSSRVAKHLGIKGS